MVENMELLAPGHRACPGCGVAIATRLILKAAGKDVIVVTSTGCLETFTSPYGQSAWEVPWIHPLFENGAAVASGVKEALKAKGNDHTKVIVMSGDGGTFDIGFGAISGMFERGHDITYICYDNEAYMNTGIQRSSSTPYAATTTTTPAGTASYGKLEPKKDLPSIALAHGIQYVATASVCFPQDLIRKVKKAISIKGPKYIQVHTPCCIGWGFDPSETIEVARLAVDTGLVPIYSIEKGKPMEVRKVTDKKPVETYLKKQNRFKHLFKGEEYEQIINELQKICDNNFKYFGLAK
jgi:pyruvate ferredoxin oxidoreductase beta subunit